MKTISLFFLLLSFHSLASGNGIDVIYGEDNRQDVYSVNDSVLVELSRSTAAMIHPSNLTLKDGMYAISGKTLAQRGICSSERFSAQVTAASCSGFFIGKNLLVTAGHCIKSNADCKTYKWVFDYRLDEEGQGKVSVPEKSVYSCAKIISRSLDSSSQDDYALIELKEDVTDRAPLKLRHSGKVTKGAPLAVIGHPSGLPTKVSDGAKVRSLKSKYFVANLDTFGGNSGSAVFNMETSEVEGILVRGETDYVFDAAKGCQVSNKCSDNGCRGEDVTYITNISGLEDIH